MTQQTKFLNEQILKIRLVREHLSNNRHIAAGNSRFKPTSDDVTYDSIERFAKVERAIEALREAGKQLNDLYYDVRSDADPVEAYLNASKGG